MAEECSFVDICPMGSSITDLSGGCVEERGEKCGPIAAYGMLIGQLDNLKDLDEASPIIGKHTITEVPDGNPPRYIRECWVGVDLPVRNLELCAAGEIEVSPADAVLALLASGEIDAAGWFIQAGVELAPLAPKWVFKTSDGVFTPTNSIPSTEFYGKNVASDVRVEIETPSPGTDIGLGVRDDTYYIAVQPPLSVSEIVELGKLGISGEITMIDPEPPEPMCGLIKVDGAEEMAELQIVNLVRALQTMRGGDINAYISPVELDGPLDTPFDQRPRE